MPVIYTPNGRAREYSHLALNHYSNCQHNCQYCYAKLRAKRFGLDFSNVSVRQDVVYRVRREAPNFKGTNRRVLLSFLTDPYQPLDQKEQITRQIIEILRQNDIPFQILTKGGTRAARDFELYGINDAFATTMTFLRDSNSILVEPNAALPGDRIKAISLAKEQDIETWVSLEPVIDTKTSLEIIDRTKDIVDHYKVGTLNHFKSNGIDWRRFGAEVINKLVTYNKSYYIKDDLKKHLKGFSFKNTDTRTVRRPGVTGKENNLF